MVTYCASKLCKGRTRINSLKKNFIQNLLYTYVAKYTHFV